MQDQQPPLEPVARENAGNADEKELNALIAAEWRLAVANPEQKSEIIALLGLGGLELDPRNPPFRAEIEGAGLTGAEVLIMFAASFAAGLAKDLGATAAKAASAKLKGLWTDYMRERVSPDGSGKLGPRRYDDGVG